MVHNMSPVKRLFDVVVAIVLAVVLLPLMAVIALVLFCFDQGPVFYFSERMKSAQEGFRLVKFRTMTTSIQDDEASGGYKNSRITPIGRFLRKTHLDELPQLWNIIVGDISFVGPRPPLRTYVEQLPELYGRVLEERPGVTGLASVYFHEHEERLLGRTANKFENNEVYCRTCIPRKARLDFIYAANKSMCFDIQIMLQTVFKFLR